MVDALRPITPALWQQLPLPEQRRFLQHLTSYWDVHRHRIAPEIDAVIQSLIDGGQLRILAGRIHHYEPTPEGVIVWETIAVPELRQQSLALAATVLQSLPVRVRPLPTRLYPLPQEEPVGLGQDWGDPVPGLAPAALIFRQFFDPESSTYPYLVADLQTRQAALVDTVLEKGDHDLQVLSDLGLTLLYCLETHIHADHITGAAPSPPLLRKNG